MNDHDSKGKKQSKGKVQRNGKMQREILNTDQLRSLRQLSGHKCAMMTERADVCFFQDQAVFCTKAWHVDTLNCLMRIS